MPDVVDTNLTILLVALLLCNDKEDAICHAPIRIKQLSNLNNGKIVLRCEGTAARHLFQRVDGINETGIPISSVIRRMFPHPAKSVVSVLQSFLR